jgi:GNAT superfamily N-acetyltransferase
MNQIQIRTANLEDLKILLSFEQGIIKAERPFDETLKMGQISYYDISQMILEPETEVAIGEINGKIVGSGYAKIIEAKPYYTFDKYAYLGFMYTDSDFRGLGINSKIIEYLKNWCISQNIFEMRLDVYETNQSAVKAYEKYGFKKDMVNMRMPIKIK